jgi:hypothetical protein
MEGRSLPRPDWAGQTPPLPLICLIDSVIRRIQMDIIYNSRLFSAVKRSGKKKGQAPKQTTPALKVTSSFEL